ncbi:MAG: ABC transporter permease subunit [Methylocystaceae bacterium]|jgi:putative spermidine/putrescine transport system permease protein|nr:ABC transporter permease subunit [Methylocystaceae bacterium]
MTQKHLGLLLLLPAFLMVLALFLFPLGISLHAAFTDTNGQLTLAHFVKAQALYSSDMIFTLFITLTSAAIVGLFSLALAGLMALSENRFLVASLKFLYRWPLFIPFIVAAQCMRTFLAKNGLMNNSLIASGLLDPSQAASFLDWRGIIITFVWKQTPFVTLMLAGAVSSLDKSMIEAARNLGASRLRAMLEIIIPQIMPSLMVGLILSFVTMMSVLSVPLMVAGSQPTLLTVDMAFRINSYGDYPTANALGVISYLMTSLVAWFYLRQQIYDPALNPAQS